MKLEEKRLQTEDRKTSRYETREGRQAGKQAGRQADRRDRTRSALTANQGRANRKCCRIARCAKTMRNEAAAEESTKEIAASRHDANATVQVFRIKTRYKSCKRIKNCYMHFFGTPPSSHTHTHSLILPRSPRLRLFWLSFAKLHTQLASEKCPRFPLPLYVCVCVCVPIVSTFPAVDAANAANAASAASSCYF